MPRSLNDILLRSAWYIFPPLVRGLFVTLQLGWRLRRPLLRCFEQVKELSPSYLTGYGSLAIFKRSPPEILEQIFLHTCGEEYIGFFNHFSLPHADDSTDSYYATTRVNTAYLLKSVCKEWKELAERSPRLWQRVYFDFDDFWVEKALFRSVQHFEDMVKHVLLRRSAGLGLHIKISGQSYERKQLDARSRMRYFVPLLNILAREGNRWSSVIIWDLDSRGTGGGNIVIHHTLESVIAHTSFPRLQSFAYDSGALGAPDPDYRSPRLDISSTAPSLKELIIRAANFENLTASSPIMKCRWSSLTTLVIDCQGISYPSPAILHVSPVFEAVRHNLVTLHWRGSSSSLPGAALPDRAVEMRSLRTLVIQDAVLAGCGRLLTSISCPMLQTLQIILFKGYFSYSDQQWTQLVPGWVSLLEKFLLLAPHLQTFTIVYTPLLEIHVLYQEKDSDKKKRLEHGYLLLLGSPSEVRTQLQPLVESNLSLTDTHDPSESPTVAAVRLNLLENPLVANVFGFTPWTAYSMKPSGGRGTEPARLLPARPMTRWERGIWSERSYGEKDRVERYLAFVQSLDKGSIPSKSVIHALRKMGDISLLVLVHALDLLARQDILLDSCKVTFSLGL